MHSAGAGLTAESVGVAPFISGQEHLLAELDLLRLVLERQVLRLRAANLLVESDFRGLFIADAYVDAVLRDDPEQTIATRLDARIQQERSAIAARMYATAEAGIDLPLVQVKNRAGLDSFEDRVLVACVAPEIDLAFEALYSYVQNDVNRKRPTVDLMLRMFTGSMIERVNWRRAFSSDGNLLNKGLVRAVETHTPDGQSFMARAFRTDDRITNLLLGQSDLAGCLRGIAHLATNEITFQQLLLPRALKQNLLSAEDRFRRSGAVFVFSGAAGTGKRSTAEALSNLGGRALIIADVAMALASPTPLMELFAALQREAFLHDANLFLDNCQALLLNNGHPGKGFHLPLISALEQSIRPAGNIIFIATDTPPSELGLRTIYSKLAFRFPTPSYEDRVNLWANAAKANGLRLSGTDFGTLGNKFVFTARQIDDACQVAAATETRQTTIDGATALDLLEAAARAQSGNGLHKLTQEIESNQSWSDLIMPARAMQQLRAVCASYRHRNLVYQQWGFGAKLAMGKGLNVLFFGPSGTGKTMAAGILANELGLNIYKIDLSSVVSKYIGETEKQLNQIFREAQSSNAVLLFDEADALFGKRSEVKDAHDRYANVETAYLLQKMEEYDGVVILTTNFRKNMDDAFARRMHHVVEFSSPDATNRLRIWNALIPSTAQLRDDVDLVFLARQFELAGGHIRNVVLAAAFLAADEAAPIGMAHLIIATARELQKIGKIPSKSEFREHYEMIHAKV
jgi:AAA+ superfamily predicted ATPase